MRIPSLEKIVKETLTAIEKSKSQIYDIAQNAHSESERVRKELQEIQHQVLVTIEKVDTLERLEKAARVRLMEVSRDFSQHSEEEVHQAYEKARELQVSLASLRERERQLKLRRSELERSLRKLVGTADKAENLVTQVGVVLDYLGGNLTWINNELELVNKRRLLAPKIIQAQEEERKRVAREIHDGPAQSMANVVLRTEVCEKLLDSDPETARKELQDLRLTVKNSLQEVRRIIFDLRPMTLDDLGLLPALNRLLESVKNRDNIVIEVNHQSLHKRLPPVLEVALYRVIQESVQNAVKHGKATKIKISLETDKENIKVMIQDNGVGFDAKNYLQQPRAESYGLLGMKERTDVLGGQLTVSSLPGEGTAIMVVLPLE